MSENIDQTAVQEELDLRENIINDFKNSYFVEAGAGAGKTHTIVQRIINQLKSGFLTADQLVVITFTKKAAAELYDRISSDLAKALKTELSADERDKLEKALLHIDTMTVSTIHSFCKKLLEQRAFDAGIPMNASITEPEEETAEKQIFFENYFKEHADMDAIKRSQSYKGDPKLWNYKQNSFEIFMAVSNKLLDRDLKGVYCPDAKLDESKGAAYYEELIKSHYGDFVSEIKQWTSEILSDDTVLWTYFLNDTAAKKADSELDFALYVFQHPDIFDEKKDEAYKEKIQEFRPQFMEIVNQKLNDCPDINKYLNYGYYAIINTGIQAAKAYNASRSSSELTNDELLTKARELLSPASDNEDVLERARAAREYFAQKYRCIYIDEFQDTDHIQKETLWALAKGNSGTIRDGSLFVVGDPKQSIYRFRGAEPQIFTETRDEFTEMANSGVKAKTAELKINFRSNPYVIRWVNEKFKKNFQSSSIGYSDMLCYPGNNMGDYDDVLRGVYQVKATAEGERSNVTDAAELCALIQSLVGKRCIYKKKNDKLTKEKIAYSDILVLTKDTNEALIYKKIFKKYNIPVSFGMKKNVSEDAVISRFCVLYSFLANNFDNKAKAGAMAQLLESDFFKAEQSEWNKALERVQALYEYTQTMSSYALAEYLSHRMDLLLPHGIINESEMTSYTAALRQMVDTVLASSNGSRQTLAAAFDAYRYSMAKNDLPLDFEYNAVRFMNFHQAKGLEGNIVIIADIGGNNTKPGNHKFQNVYYPALRSGIYNYPTVSFNDKAKEDESKARSAENLRNTYVTATRAREALIFMPKLGRNSWIKSELASKRKAVADYVLEMPLPSDIAPDVSAETTEMSYADQYSAPSPSQAAPVYSTLNPSALEDHSKAKPQPEESESPVTADYTPEGINSVSADSEEVYADEPDKETRIRRDVLGTAMHRMFELTVNRFAEDKDKSKITEYLKDAVNMALIEGIDDMSEGIGPYEKRLRGFAAEFAGDDALLDRIADADNVYTELPFSFFLSDDKEAEALTAVLGEEIALNTWVNGTADLVLEKDGKVCVLDYKSNENKQNDPNFKQTLLAKYKGQLALYKFAMKKLLNTDDVDTDIINYQPKI